MADPKQVLAKNDAVEILPSAARTALVAAIEFAGTRNLLIVIDATAATATPGVTPLIEAYNPVTGTWFTVKSMTQITGTGVSTYVLDNSAADKLSLRRMRISFAVVDTDSLTYSVTLFALS